ncbi:unnamed protein product [Dibothriocephalus latus]|uniref:Uncharacterized protein n=1 Tax=Dibothriocephalus latus TaxID=60516 RepID=A0A3P7M940_DIBLA|nr:unnamed protein product [Dibothriocephalus latus]
MTRRPAQCVSKNEAKAIKELIMDDHSSVLPADKGQSTVVINREDYNEKANVLLDEREFYRPAQSSEAKAAASPISQVAAHTYETGHEFNFAAAKIIALAGSKTGQELIEAWTSDDNSVNRCIELAPAYVALRMYLQTHGTGG